MLSCPSLTGISIAPKPNDDAVAPKATKDVAPKPDDDAIATKSDGDAVTKPIEEVATKPDDNATATKPAGALSRPSRPTILSHPRKHHLFSKRR